MSGIIYTDGHAEGPISKPLAARLLAEGLIEPHPGAGENGIDSDDFRLTQFATWADVTGLVR